MATEMDQAVNTFVDTCVGYDNALALQCKWFRTVDNTDDDIIKLWLELRYEIRRAENRGYRENISNATLDTAERVLR